MKTVLILLWSGLAALLGWVAIVHKAPEIQSDILGRTSAAVSSVNPNAQTLVDGRGILLRGPELSEEAKKLTLATARNVWGALGPADGLWVNNGKTTPLLVNLEKTAQGDIVTWGTMNTADRQKFDAILAESVATPIRDDIRLVDEAARLGDISSAVKALAKLDAGILILQPGHNILAGQTVQKSTYDALSSSSASATPELMTFIQGPRFIEALPSRSRPTGHFLLTKTPDSSLTVSGNLASEAQKAAIFERLEAGKSNRLADHTTMDKKNLPDNWNARLMSGAQALLGLDTGTLVLNDDVSFLSGTATQKRIDAIRSGLPSNWHLSLLPSSPGSAQLADRPIPMASPPFEPKFRDAGGPGNEASDAEECAGTLAPLLARQEIYFNTASVIINKSNMVELNSINAAVKPCINLGRLKIIGHTDSVGADPFNDALSLNRAKSVKDVFVRQGLNPEHISIEGRGKRQPVASEPSGTTRARERRVTFEWLNN